MANNAEKRSKAIFSAMQSQFHCRHLDLFLSCWIFRDGITFSGCNFCVTNTSDNTVATEQRILFYFIWKNCTCQQHLNLFVWLACAWSQALTGCFTLLAHHLGLRLRRRRLSLLWCGLKVKNVLLSGASPGCREQEMEALLILIREMFPSLECSTSD